MTSQAVRAVGLVMVLVVSGCVTTNKNVATEDPTSSQEEVVVKKDEKKEASASSSTAASCNSEPRPDYDCTTENGCWYDDGGGRLVQLTIPPENRFKKNFKVVCKTGEEAKLRSPDEGDILESFQITCGDTKVYGISGPKVQLLSTRNVCDNHILIFMEVVL